MSNIMRGLISANEVNVAAIFLKTQCKTVLLVEGDDDSHFFGKFITVDKPYTCTITIAGGKGQVIKALELSEQENRKGVIAIVDADFWRIDKKSHPSPNLFMTDTHDIETMMFASSAFGQVLGGVGDNTKISTLSDTVLHLILKSAEPVGYLRLLSSKSHENLYINFKSFSFKEFVDEKTLALDIDKLLQEAQRKTPTDIGEIPTLKKKLSILMTKDFDGLQICSGKDLLDLLGIAVRFIFGKGKHKRVNNDTLALHLKLAYTKEDLQKTRLYASIKKWETEHYPHMVFQA